MPNIEEICSRCGHPLGWAFRNFEYVEGKVRHIDCPALQPPRDVVLVDRELLREALRGMKPIRGGDAWAIIESLVREPPSRGQSETS